MLVNCCSLVKNQDSALYQNTLENGSLQRRTWMWAASARTCRTGNAHKIRLGYLLSPEREGMPPLYQQSKEVIITCQFWSINTTATNTMLIIIIVIIISKIQFLLHIHRKDLFFFSPLQQKWHSIPPTLQDFILQAIDLSPIILVFWGLLGVVLYWITE